MTLNCILVYDSITERFFRTPGPWTKYLSALFFSFNKQYSNINYFRSLIFLTSCNVLQLFFIHLKLISNILLNFQNYTN